MEKQEHFKRRNNLLQLDSTAKEIAKQVIAINADKRVSNAAIHAMPINTFVFNPALMPFEIQQKITELGLNESFATFNKENGSYEIYISTLTKKEIDELINKDGTISIGDDILNLSDDFNNLVKKLATDFYKHELAHTKISSLQNLNELDRDDIPFSLINVLEDVRVNSFWKFDKKYELLFNKLYKLNPEVFQSNKTGYDILFPICVTLNDPKYTYLSPDTEFCKYIFNKAQNANNIFEISQIAKEFLEEMQKRHPNQKQEQNQSSGIKNKEGGEKQQSSQKNKQNKQDQGQGGNNDFDIKEDEDENEDNYNDYGYLDDYDDFSKSYKTIEEPKEYPSEEYGNNYDEKNSHQGKNLFDNKGDLIDGFDENSKAEIEEIIVKIKDEAIKITDNGAVVRNLDHILDTEMVQRVAAVYGRKRDFKNNDLENILGKPLASIQKGDITLNLSLVNKYFQIAKDQLSKFFPKTRSEASSKLSKKLNTKKIASLPFNPTLKDVFKEPQKRKKEPVELTFFLDLSGSMRGNPIFNSKHLLAVVKKLQDENYVNANVVLHKGGHTDCCSIIKFKNFKQKPLETISALIVGYDEGIINAIEHSVKTIRQELRRSRAVFFLTDGNLCDNPQKIKAAMSKIENKNIIGLYAGDKNNTELSRYFPNFISAKRENSKDLEKVLKMLVKTVVEIANPDLTAKKAIARIAKDPDIASSYELETNNNIRVNKNAEGEDIHSGTKARMS